MNYLNKTQPNSYSLYTQIRLLSIILMAKSNFKRRNTAYSKLS
jgi:hypothetical protein